MMILEKSHNAVFSRIKHFLTTTGTLTDITEKFSDYDSLDYILTGISADCLTFTVQSRQLTSIGNAGGFESVSSFFQGHPSSIDAETISLVINREELPPPDSPARAQAAEAIARKFSQFRSVFLSGPFVNAFNAVKAGKTSDSVEINIRPRENLWIVAGSDRVTFVFQIHYDDKTDANLAKVFVQEFMEARRQVKNSPIITFTPNPPDYVESFPSSQRETSVGFMSVTILENQVVDIQKQAEWLCGFKQYLSYHVHACKTYLHMRIRKRTDSLLATLKLAVPEHLDEKVFRRSRAAKTMKEETKIINNFKK